MNVPEISLVIPCHNEEQNLRPLLAASDVVALPSTSVETFSLAALEAMALGRPVVLSEIGGAAEMVRPGENGFLFPAHDTPAVLKAYMEKFDVGPGWTFLTGNAADIRAVTKKLGLSRYSDSANKDGHTAILMVGDVPGGQWVRHSAVDNPEFLASSLATFFGWRDLQGRSYTEAQPLNVGQGEYLFASRCSACHSLGQGDKMGPDLLGVTARRERTWLLRYIQVPDQVLASGDPIAKALNQKYQNVRMPNVSLGGADAAAIVSYLEGHISTSAPASPGGPAVRPDGSGRR